jgi:hypothetical protein
MVCGKHLIPNLLVNVDRLDNIGSSFAIENTAVTASHLKTEEIARAKRSAFCETEKPRRSEAFSLSIYIFRIPG